MTPGNRVSGTNASRAEHSQRMDTGRAAAKAGPLAVPLVQFRGVGPERAAQLARLGLSTVGDLLWHRPHRYEDRRQILSIASLELNQPATVRGKIVALGIKRY